MLRNIARGNLTKWVGTMRERMLLRIDVPRCATKYPETGCNRGVMLCISLCSTLQQVFRHSYAKGCGIDDGDRNSKSVERLTDDDLPTA